MLKQRVVTAVLLLLVLIPVLFYPAPEPFMGLTLLLIGAAGWEWGRLNGLLLPASLSLGLAAVLSCALLWWLGWVGMDTPRLWLLSAAGWVLGGSLLLARGVGYWTGLARAPRLALGFLILVLAWLALAQARHLGINFLLSVLLLVWVADISAYFAGHAFGRYKLAPSISPGKSWEGVGGGLAGVVLLATAWVLADSYWQAQRPSLYTILWLKWQGMLLLGLAYLVALGVVGDLLESLVKRGASVKDSSGLLPGHGGVLDRIDALLPALPAAMMLASLGAAP